MSKSTIPEVIQAQALLSTVHHLMTGREISFCEDVAENGDAWSAEDWDCFEVCDGQDFRSLTIQFSSEIANWINKAA